jgi:hypothetical protein
MSVVRFVYSPGKHTHPVAWVDGKPAPCTILPGHDRRFWKRKRRTRFPIENF